MRGHDQVSRQRLFELLMAAVDGINGYEAEVGDLHPYWNRTAIEEARGVIAAWQLTSSASSGSDPTGESAD